MHPPAQACLNLLLLRLLRGYLGPARYKPSQDSQGGPTANSAAAVRFISYKAP